MGEVAENGETPYRVLRNKIGYTACVGLGAPRHARWIAGTQIIQLTARTAYLYNAAPAWYSRFGIHSDRCVGGIKTSLTARYSDGTRPNHVCWYPTVPVRERRFAMRLAGGPLVARHGRIPCTRRRQSSVVLPRLGHGHTLTRTNVSCQSPVWGKTWDVFGFPSIPCLAYRRGVITCAENQSISSFVAEAHQVASSPCIVRCKQITAIIVLTLMDKRSNRYSASCSSKKRVEWTSTRLTIKWFRWHWKRMLRWMQYSSCIHLRRMHIERATWLFFSNDALCLSTSF